jgi:hypothetical protein
MYTSGVSMKADDAKAGHTADEFRTSTQHSLGPSTTDELVALSRRVQLLTRLPVANVEQIQVLRYLETQHYSAHHDFFDPGDYSAGTRHAAKERGLASNRLATVSECSSDPRRTHAGPTPTHSARCRCDAVLPTVSPAWTPWVRAALRRSSSI